MGKNAIFNLHYQLQDVDECPVNEQMINLQIW